MNALCGVEPAAEEVTQRARWASWIALAVAGLKEAGPYVAIEIILPGGTLIALLLWLYRRRQPARPQGFSTPTPRRLKPGFGYFITLIRQRHLGDGTHGA